MHKRSTYKLKQNYLSVSRRILFVTIINGLVFLLQVQSSRRIKKTVLRNWHSSMPSIRSTKIKLCWRTPRWFTIFNTSLRTILSERRKKVRRQDIYFSRSLSEELYKYFTFEILHVYVQRLREEKHNKLDLITSRLRLNFLFFQFIEAVFLPTKKKVLSKVDIETLILLINVQKLSQPLFDILVTVDTLKKWTYQLFLLPNFLYFSSLYNLNNDTRSQWNVFNASNISSRKTLKRR